MTIILPATAKRARRTQREHDLAEGGWWCKQCFRDGLGRIKAGLCDAYTDAEAVLVAYDAQRITRSRPSARGRAPVPVPATVLAGVVWRRPGGL